MAADEPQARGDRALQGATRRGRDRRRRLPRALPLQPRRAGRRDLREVDRRRCATRSTPRPRSRPTPSSSTSARTSAPASTRASSASCAALEQILERCDGDTWLLMENSAGAGGTIGRSLEELATLLERLDRPSAARHLPRLVPPLRLRLRRHRPGRGRRARRRARRARSGSTACARCTSTTAAAPLGSNRDRHANILEGELGEGLGAFLSIRACRGSRPCSRPPGPRTGPRRERDPQDEGAASALAQLTRPAVSGV